MGGGGLTSLGSTLSASLGGRIDERIIGADAGLSYAVALAAASSQYLSCPDKADLRITSDFSVCGWVKPTATAGTQLILSKRTPTDEWECYQQNGALGFLVFHAGTNTSVATGAILANAWSFFVATYTAATKTLAISVNGTAAATAVSGAAPDTGTSPFQVGGYSGGFYFDGAVDSVCLSQRVFTAGEIASLYNGGLGCNYASAPTSVKDASLSSWWDLEEATGSRVDRVGNNPLTPNGTPLPGNAAGIPL